MQGAAHRIGSNLEGPLWWTRMEHCFNYQLGLSDMDYIHIYVYPHLSVLIIIDIILIYIFVSEYVSVSGILKLEKAWKFKKT